MPLAAEALRVLGDQVRIARHRRGWSAQSLADRIGVTRKTIHAIESGTPTVATGTAFNAAFMTGVPLFGIEDRIQAAEMRRRGEEIISLLPARVDTPREDDDELERL